jgi:hypothetical protein
MSNFRKGFCIGGCLNFSTAQSLSGLSVQTPLGRLLSANRRLSYKHQMRVKASESVGKSFYFLRVGEGLSERLRALEMIREAHLRPAVMSETFSIASLPFSQIRAAAIQTVNRRSAGERDSFCSKVCLLCAGSDMFIDEYQLSPLVACEDHVPVVVNAINAGYKVHRKLCIPVTDHLFERWA